MQGAVGAKLSPELVRRAAERAGCPFDRVHVFGRLLQNAVAQATRTHNNKNPRQSQRVAVKKYLVKARTAIENLLPEQPGDAAGTILMATMADDGNTIELDNLVEYFDAAIKNANRLLRGRGAPTGTRGHTAFDALLTNLLMMEVHCRNGDSTFKWTASAGGWSDGVAQGSLIDVLLMLQQAGHLPKGLVPGSAETLEQAVERKRAEIAGRKSHRI